MTLRKSHRSDYGYGLATLEKRSQLSARTIDLIIMTTCRKTRQRVKRRKTAGIAYHKADPRCIESPIQSGVDKYLCLTDATIQLHF